MAKKRWKPTHRIIGGALDGRPASIIGTYQRVYLEIEILGVIRPVSVRASSIAPIGWSDKAEKCAAPAVEENRTARGRKRSGAKRGRRVPAK